MAGQLPDNSGWTYGDKWAIGLSAGVALISIGMWFGTDQRHPDTQIVEEPVANAIPVPVRAQTTYDTSYVGHYRLVKSQDGDWHQNTYTHMQPVAGDLFQIDSSYTIDSGQKHINNVSHIYYLGRSASGEDMHLEEYVSQAPEELGEDEAYAASLSPSQDTLYHYGQDMVFMDPDPNSPDPVGLSDDTAIESIEAGDGIKPPVSSQDTKRYNKHLQKMLRNFATAKPVTLTKQQAYTGTYLQPVMF